MNIATVPEFDATRVAAATAAITACLPALEWITDGRVEHLSQDFY